MLRWNQNGILSPCIEGFAFLTEGSPRPAPRIQVDFLKETGVPGPPNPIFRAATRPFLSFQGFWGGGAPKDFFRQLVLVTLAEAVTQLLAL